MVKLFWSNVSGAHVDIELLWFANHSKFCVSRLTYVRKFEEINLVICSSPKSRKKSFAFACLQSVYFFVIHFVLCLCFVAFCLRRNSGTVDVAWTETLLCFFSLIGKPVSDYSFFHIKAKGDWHSSWLSGFCAEIICCMFVFWFCIIPILIFLIMISCMFINHLVHWSLKLSYLLACCQVVAISLGKNLASYVSIIRLSLDGMIGILHVCMTWQDCMDWNILIAWFWIAWKTWFDCIIFDLLILMCWLLGTLIVWFAWLDCLLLDCVICMFSLSVSCSHGLHVWTLYWFVLHGLKYS